MSLIRRPLTGGSGLGTPFALAVAPGTTIHTFNQSAPGIGGPFPQRITLWVENATAGDLDVTITINGVALVRTLTAGAIVQIFDSQPMLASASSGAGSLINGIGEGAGIVAWGFFETQT